jgi:iron(III) transport system ATP-binding protein
VEIATLTRETGATVVYITHDQSEAFALADRIGVLRGGRLVQHGSPESIYHEPYSPFVARFTGLAGELRACVEEVHPDGVVVSARGWRLRVRAPVPVRSGISVDVLLRSGALALKSVDDSAQLSGVVRDTAYRGRGYDRVVELPGGALLCGIFDTRPWRRDEEVALAVAGEGCFAYPVDGSGG